MSMFSGLTNQISGWVANKTGGVGGGQDGQEAVDPNGQQQSMENGGEGGEVLGEGAEQAPNAGGVTGLAQGLMMKAMSAKQGLQEKAGHFTPPNLGGIGGNLMANVTNLIPGRKEEEVPTPPEPNPPSELGVGGEYIEEQSHYAE